MQDALRVPRQLPNLRHGRVAPDLDVKLAKPVAADKLPVVRVPRQRRDLVNHDTTCALHASYQHAWRAVPPPHLALCVDAVEQGAGRRVVKLDGAVGRAAASGQQVALKGGPGHCLDRRLVRRQLQRRGRVAQAPDANLVVVAAAVR